MPARRCRGLPYPDQNPCTPLTIPLRDSAEHRTLNVMLIRQIRAGTGQRSSSQLVQNPRAGAAAAAAGQPGVADVRDVREGRHQVRHVPSRRRRGAARPRAGCRGGDGHHSADGAHTMLFALLPTTAPGADCLHTRTENSSLGRGQLNGRQPVADSARHLNFTMLTKLQQRTSKLSIPNFANLWIFRAVVAGGRRGSRAVGSRVAGGSGRDRPFSQGLRSGEEPQRGGHAPEPDRLRRVSGISWLYWLLNYCGGPVSWSRL